MADFIFLKKNISCSDVQFCSVVVSEYILQIMYVRARRAAQIKCECKEARICVCRKDGYGWDLEKNVDLFFLIVAVNVFMIQQG